MPPETRSSSSVTSIGSPKTSRVSSTLPAVSIHDSRTPGPMAREPNATKAAPTARLTTSTCSAWLTNRTIPTLSR